MNEARLPPPLPFVVVRRVTPAGVVHVRAELDLSTQYRSTVEPLVATFAAGAGCAVTVAVPCTAEVSTVTGAASA